MPAMAGHSYRQLLSFGVITAARMRATVETVGVFDVDRCVGLATVRIKRLPLRAGGVAYISGGPLIPGDATGDDLHLTLQALANEYVRRRKLVLRIVPPVEWALGEWCCDGVFASLGFRVAPGIRPYRTIMVDLTEDVAAIRSRLHPKWRNCLSSAEREGLEVRVSTDDEDLARFGRLHEELMARKGFNVDLDVDVYRRVHRMSVAEDGLEVRLVEQNGVPVAGHVSSALGQSKVFLFGASTPEGNRHKASYLLQWDALDCGALPWHEVVRPRWHRPRGERRRLSVQGQDERHRRDSSRSVRTAPQRSQGVGHACRGAGVPSRPAALGTRRLPVLTQTRVIQTATSTTSASEVGPASTASMV